MYLDFMINVISMKILFDNKFNIINNGITLFFRYFCTGKKNEINLIPDLQKCGILNDVNAAVNLVAYHCNSLIYHVNNNCAETYNSVVAKYVGGKRVNYSLRGTYYLYTL